MTTPPDRVIRDYRFAPEEALDNRKTVIDAVADAKGPVIGPYYPREPIPAGDPLSSSGAKIAFDELDATLQTSLNNANPAQVVTVAKSGGDFVTVENALAAITDATASKRYVVVVYPGDYVESNPVVCKNFVSIDCPGRHEATRLICANPGSHGLVLASDIDVTGLQVRDASGVGSAGFHVPAGTSDFHLHDCKSRNCDWGIIDESGGTGTQNAIREFIVTGGSGTGIIKITAGTRLDVSDLFVSEGVVVTTDMLSEGAGAVLGLRNVNLLATATNGLLAQTGGKIVFSAVDIDHVVNGLRARTNGTVRGSSIAVESSSRDVLVESTGTVLVSGGGFMRSDVECQAGGKCVLAYFDATVEGDEAQVIEAELHVGSFNNPKEAVFGGGDSYVFDELVHQYDASAVSGSRFISKTTEARSFSGSTWGFPAGAAVGDAIVWGVPRKYPGLKVMLNTLMTKASGPDTVIVWEFWDGAAWVAFEVLDADANAPFLGHANDVFVNSLSIQLRFDDAFLGSWVAADDVLDQIPNYGSAHFCVRARITGQAPTVAPIFEQTKIHPPGRAEINPGGEHELLGTGEQLVVVARHHSVDFVAPPTNAPTVADILVSPNITYNGVLNRFRDNFLSVLLLGASIPLFVDTSRKAIFRIIYYCEEASVADIEWKIDFAVIEAGGIYDGTATEVTASAVAALPGVIGQRTSIDVAVNLSSVKPGSDLHFRMYRDGGVFPDGGDGPVVFVRVDVIFTKYRL